MSYEKLQIGCREGYRPLSKSDISRIKEYQTKIGHDVDEVEDECAGCIVFTHDPISNELLVLLIENFGNWYSFPKGHKQENEDDITAAIRETYEETGIQLTGDQIVDNSQNDVKYTIFGKMHKDRWATHPDYPNNKKRPMVITYKRVAHFSAIIPYPNQPPVPQLSEVKGVAFHSIPEALKLLGPVIGPQLEEQLKMIQ